MIFIKLKNLQYSKKIKLTAVLLLEIIDNLALLEVEEL